nr:restriction endonuclease subunit S [uncultured Deefgea sp.]
MSARQKFKLDELGTVGRGKSKHRPRNDPSLYGGPYPFFQTGDVKAAELYLREYSQTYSDAGLAQSKLWQPGTLCITIAANVADTAILAIPGCFPDSVVGFIANPEKADARFIKYYIDVIKRQMVSASKGTTQDNLSVDKLLMFDFEVPLVCEQTHIADIISAYDDLIENNTRRIAVLEEMARRIYEEWFVHFRYPGHEQAQKVETELGLVPEGWEVKQLGECSVYVNRGITPKYDDAAEGLVINQKCIRNGKLSMAFARRQSKVPPSDKVVRYGDVLINSTGVGTLGRVTQICENLNNVTVDTHVSIVRPRPELDVEFFGLALLRLEPHFEQQGVGATGQTELSRARIAETPMLIPPFELQVQFSNMVSAMRKQPLILSKKNANLRQTRDLLLPRLISGELDVSKLVLPDVA